MLAQSKRDCSAFQALESKFRELTATVAAAFGGGGGGSRRRQHSNKNPPDTFTKPASTVYRKWNKYCYSCGIVICNKAGCGVGIGADCNRKKEVHKPDTTFTNKMGGNTKRDHLWNMWCEPGMHHRLSVLPAGAQTQE